jgi:hypothetical protein
MTLHNWIAFTFGTDTDASRLFTQVPQGDGAEIASYCIAFLENPQPIVRNVPRDVLSYVFEVFPGIDGYMGLLSCSDIPFEARCRLAWAEVSFFRQVFYDDGFESSATLWWERLPWARWMNGPMVVDDVAICNELLGVLNEILGFGSRICVESALRGVREIGPFADEETALKILKSFLSGKWSTDSNLMVQANLTLEDLESS